MPMTPTASDITTDIRPPAKKPISWKSAPLTVGTISTSSGLAYLLDAPAGVDIVEVRLDLLLSKGVSPDKIQDALAKRTIPALLTLRTRDEGGSFNWRSRQRVLFFLKFIPFVDAVDLELTNLPRLGRVLRMVRKTKRDLVLSSHSLRRKLTPLRLRRLLTQFRKTRASVYKIVGLARRRRDVRALAEPLLTHSICDSPSWVQAPSRPLLVSPCPHSDLAYSMFIWTNPRPQASPAMIPLSLSPN